jgi:ESAT-6 family protein
MSDEIAVNYTQLAAAEADLSASVQAIRAALDTLNSDLQPLFASWQGDGGEAYTIQQKNWETASADLNLTLGKVQVEVGNANALYQLTDSRIASAWNG